MVHMTQGSDELHFFYDAQNKPAVVVYNGVPYSYVKNLQGDIVAILDSSKNVVVSYVYDAWGRPISKTGSMAATLGTVQPFRYRGYVYDEENGFYYLRSRYYNPNWCKLLNVDTILGQWKLLGHDIFNYCWNNPISYRDLSGHEAEWNVYVVYVRQPLTPMFDKDYYISEMVNYDTGPIYTTDLGVDTRGCISVYYFDSNGDEHVGYMRDVDIIVWYGMSPKMMDLFYQRYFGDFFEDQDADINFLRRDNSYFRMNAALDVMLKQFLDTRDSKDSTSIFVNNHYDYSTEWAVREFQAHEGITVDGIAGKETLDALWNHYVSVYRHFVPE